MAQVNNNIAVQVLDETLNKSNIESFKAADMYAFGLVLWEITRRTLTGDKVTSPICCTMSPLTSSSSADCSV